MGPRSPGRRGRTEVWYTTATDQATGTGVWLHHETVAPTDGSPAYAHGWVALFPPGQPPTCVCFGPDQPQPPSPPAAPGFHTDTVHATARTLQGHSPGAAVWDLTVAAGSRLALHALPRTSWKHRLLPTTHVVAQPGATLTGTLRVGAHQVTLHAAPGATARIDGHGSALRWGWLHADLGDGDILEVVAAVAKAPVLRRLPPLVFLRLRTGGHDWPRGQWRSALGLLGAGRFRADPRLPCWAVTGHTARRRIHIEVAHNPHETVSLTYTNPDHSTTICHNSERADATIRLQHRATPWGPWKDTRTWQLHGTGHAEVGGAP
jgi:hypothetical protein